MTRFMIDMGLAAFAGLNAAAFASDGRPVALGMAVACGIAALVRYPSKR